MPLRSPIPASPAFETLSVGSQFHDRIALPVRASPEAIFQAFRQVRLRDMKLAWLLGELRYLPARLGGHAKPADTAQPFLQMLLDGGTLVLHDDAPREIVTGSAAQLHRIDQRPQRFASRQAFAAFADPDHEKLFMSIRVAPTGRPGEHWLVLEHATRALSIAAEQRFARYWQLIRPTGAFVTWLLLRAVRRRAERATDPAARPWPVWRSVRATPSERSRALPGDGMIPEAMDTLTHGVTIRRPPREVWPWLVQMGAGSRAGWYSYDWLDNGRQRSARRIVPELQHPAIGTVFPALPGVADGFSLLALEPERTLVLGWNTPQACPEVTWAFVLEEAQPGVTRLVVRARGGPGYRFHGLPLQLTRIAVRVVHFVMQRKQLLGIAARVEENLQAGDPVAERRPDAA